MSILSEKVITELRTINRDGIKFLLDFLAGSDFFTAPASIKQHLAYPEGLIEHSLNVLDCARRLNKNYGDVYLDETLIVTALGHDLCKINCYHIVDEPPTAPQLRYVTSLMNKVGLKVPAKLNKAYVGILIEFMLREYKNDGVIPLYTLNYRYGDILPLGHGEKSLYILSQFIVLTIEEALAIRWHMEAFDLNQASPYQKYAYQDAVKVSKLVSILQLADMEATHLMEE